MVVAAEQEIVVNLYRPNAPLVGKVVETYSLVGEGAPGLTKHIILSLPDPNFRYVEGQSIGIIPPGTDAKGKPHKPRLYSIASTRYGDDGEGKTVSLSIKRAEYVDTTTGQPGVGVCSGFLTDAQVGDDVMITGPAGKTFLLPEDANATLILIATGTGIAPFRAFIKHLFEEDPSFTGNIWLFFGVPTSSTLLYHEDLERYRQLYGDRFRVDYAISREQKNDKGEKMYVQNRMAEYSHELWDLLQKPSTYTYICGLKGMEDGINAIMNPLAEAAGLEWSKFQKDLKKSDKWHEETY
ncbi:MAG: ferredoxin--NADP(+) reductase [Cyanobacteriota bacterium]|nr:ferredoxin--NADP(+) reductase [Cyanobacteriota bacterium]